MPDEEKEVIATSETTIRKTGCVYVTTIPSKLMAVEPVRKSKGRKGLIQVVKRGNRIFIEIPISFSFDGRFLEVKRE